MIDFINLPVFLQPGNLEESAKWIAGIAAISTAAWQGAKWIASRPRWAEIKVLAWARSKKAREQERALLAAILKEFRPNGGSSFKDGQLRMESALARLEDRFDKSDQQISRVTSQIGGYFNFADEALWQSDAEGAVVWVNKRFCDLTGYDLPQMLGANWKNTIHPDDLPHVAAAWADAVHDRRTYHGTHRIVHGKSGEIINLRTSGDPMRDCQGVVTGWFGRALLEVRATNTLPESVTHGGRRVLWVEDGQDMITVIGHRLRLRVPGVSVSVTGSGRDALEQISDARANGHPFEIVVLDVQMPGMSGIEVAHLIREDERHNNYRPCHLAFCTGVGEDLTPALLADLNAQVFMKPNHWNAIENWLRAV